MEILEDITKLNALALSLSENDRVQAPHAFHNRASAAKKVLSHLEFPTTKREYWKYTRTGKLQNKKWQFSKNLHLDHLPNVVQDLDNRLVFINGFFSKEYSNFDFIEGLTFSPFSNAEYVLISELEPYLDFDNTPFLALNQAMPQDGYSLYVDAKSRIEEMIHIVNIYSGNEIIAQPRAVIHLEKGADLRITEYHIHTDESVTFANTAHEIKLNNNSTLGIDCIQMGSTRSFHNQQIDAVLGRDTHYTQNNFTLSGSWTRNNSNVRIQGENSEVHLNGFYLPSGDEHVDNHTIVDHEVPHCESNELYRGVILDRATAVFNGKVYVRPNAQKTNAFQSNGNILGSNDATANSKPELEIYADDVKCSHGSTTGQIDDEAIFYLMTRGISKPNARNLMVAAFAADVLNNLVNPEVSTLIENSIRTKLDLKK